MSMSDPVSLSVEDLEAYEQQMIREAGEWLPKKDDRLFVETDHAVRLDPLGSFDPSKTEERPLIGRRGLYSDGFLEAADRLVNGLCAKDAVTTPGAALIYPILFLYRHHLELELKGLILYNLRFLSGLDQATIEKKIGDFKRNHGLKTLWEKFQSLYPDCNKWASAECHSAFQGLLFELDEHDPTGQAGRYETDSHGNQTLTRLAFVDLPAFKVGIHKLSHYLGCIYEEIGEEMEWRDEAASW